MKEDILAERLKEYHKLAPFTLQRQDPDTGEWRNVGEVVRGKKAAFEKLSKMKDGDSGEWRAIPTNEAEAYRQGLKQGKEIGKSQAEDRRLPRGMVFPENL